MDSNDPKKWQGLDGLLIVVVFMTLMVGLSYYEEWRKDNEER